MKTYLGSLAIVLLTALSLPVKGQQRDMQYFRYPDQRGLNVFETSKLDSTDFDGLKVRLGGAFAIQYQALSHSNNASRLEDGEGNDMNQLTELGENFNLPTANLNLDVQLAKGVRMNVATYLSSRHHHEAYVKGGYLQIDRLDFIKEGFAAKLMDMVTIKVGQMENNYGDAHFRRSDNAGAIYNPFVGNYIMDGFTTEVGGEVYIQKNGLITMIGLTNGKLNQSVTDPGGTKPAFIGKLGYDKQLSSDFRMRITGSIYTIGTTARPYLYGGDRAGSRYYSVMQGATATSDNFTSGRWNPGFADNLTAVMINPFVKWGGLEFFGTYEITKGGDYKGASESRTWNQLAGEAIYRFGPREKVYAGVRYNTAFGKLANSDPDEVRINRSQVGMGWFLTRNVLAKLEYVNQTYNNFQDESIYKGGKFNGVMLEAVVSF